MILIYCNNVMISNTLYIVYHFNFHETLYIYQKQIQIMGYHDLKKFLEYCDIIYIC